MPRYRAVDDNWVFIPPRSHRDNDWKVAMLGYRGAKQGLLDIHLIASKPTRKELLGCARDLMNTEKQHIYYPRSMEAGSWRIVLRASRVSSDFPALKDSAGGAVESRGVLPIGRDARRSTRAND